MSPRETYEFCQCVLETEAMSAEELARKFPIGSMVCRENKPGCHRVMGYKKSIGGWVLIFDTHQDYAFFYEIPKRVLVAEELTNEDMDALRPTVVFEVS